MRKCFVNAVDVTHNMIALLDLMSKPHLATKCVLVTALATLALPGDSQT